MSDAIRPYRIDIPQSTLDDLSARLANARWPDAEPVEDWSQGIALSYSRDLASYWRDHYDWRRCEAELNNYPQFVTEIKGVDIHFLHIRSPHAEARPLLMTHGWPGSIIEFLDVIGALSEPVAHGGDAKDAYHLIIPSLPGYGFSGKPRTTGWGIEKIAEAWHELMARLGYDRWFAQGGDWGAMVTSMIGVQDKGGCAGLHINLVITGAPPAEVLTNPTPEEARGMQFFQRYQSRGIGYAEIQRTRPQTLGYGLADSPVGQMAWIVEKFQGWAEESATPDDHFSRDRLLDNVMLYWLNNAGASSARIYWESFSNANVDPVLLPTGCSIFPHEIVQPSRRWAAQRYRNINYFNRPEKGGHFAALEEPEIFVNEVRSAFAEMTL
ncbi:MAG: epoxide hydrolase [Parasphingorhabdus sp.]|nr:epoxide hydrolase [Parasphingorhabdus sp.]